MEAIEKGDIPLALRSLAVAQRSPGRIPDYVAYFIARAHEEAKNYTAVNAALDPVWRTSLVSPLRGRAAMLGARAYLELEQPAAGVKLLLSQESELPQPEALLLLGQLHEKAGNPGAAAGCYQQVYYRYPLAVEAGEAGRALVRLGAAAPVGLRFERAQKLLEARQGARARAEFSELAQSLTGPERDRAQVRMGAADYVARRPDSGVAYLSALRVNDAEAEAERLYWLAVALKREDRNSEAVEAVRALSDRAPKSSWRKKALVEVAYSFLLLNDPGVFVPLYESCAAAFNDDPDTALCHWRALWRSVLERKPNAESLLKEHLKRYPASDRSAASLYWLGRLAEERGDGLSARAYFQFTVDRFPNQYYPLLAQERLRSAGLPAGAAPAATAAFLRDLSFPDKRGGISFELSATGRERLARARELETAGLTSWAESELRFSARREGQGYALASDLAEIATSAGHAPRALRHVKGVAPNYLAIPRSAAPLRFWKAAFPWPYRAEIVEWCQERGLDPYLVAGLIRQESEFDPQVRSYAGAIGLTQVMPATGRELARRVGMRGFTARQLTNADINLRLGTYYMKDLLNRFSGSVEMMLAGYNGGPSRAVKWNGWSEFREPAEFVETIAIDQSREYVQIILRNAAIYRELYQHEPVPPKQVRAAAPVSSPAAKAPARKSTRKAPARKRK